MHMSRVPLIESDQVDHLWDRTSCQAGGCRKIPGAVRFALPLNFLETIMAVETMVALSHSRSDLYIVNLLTILRHTVNAMCHKYTALTARLDSTRPQETKYSASVVGPRTSCEGEGCPLAYGFRVKVRAFLLVREYDMV